MPKLSDQEIIDGLRAGGQESEKIMFSLYDSYFPLYYKVRSKGGLSDDELISVYSDALIEFKKQVIAGEYQKKGKLKGYFYRIFSNKAIDAFRKVRRTKKRELPISIEPNKIKDDSLGPAQEMIVYEEQDIQVQEFLKELLQQAMEKLSKKCKEILIDRLAEGKKPKEIANKYPDIKNARVASTTVYNCRKKLLEIIEKLKE